jgi:signal peptide peptidase SppA
MNNLEPWMGDQASAQVSLDQLAAMNQAVMRGTAPSDRSTPDSEYSLHGNVAVVSVSGPLVNIDSPLARFFGMASYPIIRNDLIGASQDQNTKAIVLSISSGGGTPNGLSDTSALIRQISDAGIPVYAHADGIMGSAATWLGVSADKVFASDLATVGSIGVVAVHKDYTKALENEGIKATVLRSGEFKALGGPYEPLTDKAKAELQSKMDKLNELFVNHVAERRGVSPAVVDSRMGQGREFIGAQAQAVGLIDGITSLDKLVQSLQGSIDQRKPTHGTENPTVKKRLLTQQAVNLIAEGVEITAAVADTPEVPKDAPQTPEALETPEPKEAAPAAQGEVVSATLEATPSDPSLVSYLQAQVAESQEKLLAANLKAAQMETEMTAMKATHDQMKGIVAISVNRMRVAMGGASMDLSSLPAEVILAEHSKALGDFTKTFPVGGVAAAASVEPEAQTPAAQAIRPGVLRAVRLNSPR